jgi:hypothetical protein
MESLSRRVLGALGEQNGGYVRFCPDGEVIAAIRPGNDGEVVRVDGQIEGGQADGHGEGAKDQRDGRTRT